MVGAWIGRRVARGAEVALRRRRDVVDRRTGGAVREAGVLADDLRRVRVENADAHLRIRRQKPTARTSTSAAASHEFVVYISERLDPRQIPGAEQTAVGREFEAGAGGGVGAGRPTVIHRSQPRNEGGVCVAESNDHDPDVRAVVTTARLCGVVPVVDAWSVDDGGSGGGDDETGPGLREVDSVTVGVHSKAQRSTRSLVLGADDRNCVRRTLVPSERPLRYADAWAEGGELSRQVPVGGGPIRCHRSVALRQVAAAGATRPVDSSTGGIVDAGRLTGVFSRCRTKQSAIRRIGEVGETPDIRTFQ